MTIQNKEWFKVQVLRRSLEGYSQEAISHEFNISEGTVNAIWQELTASDSTLVLQHEIAVISKKANISIKQLAANLAFTNAIIKMGFESSKIYLILRALDSTYGADGGLESDRVANIFLHVCNLVVKNGVPVEDLYAQINEKYLEQNKLNEQINETKKTLTELDDKKKSELEKYNLTAEQLDKFANLWDDFEEAGIDFSKREEVRNVLYVIDEMRYDAKAIIGEIKRIKPLRLEQMRLSNECYKIAENLERFKKKETSEKARWGSYFSAVDLLNKLLQEGTNIDIITKIVEIINRHKNYLSLDELVREIETYAGIKGAIFMKVNEFNGILTAIMNMDLSGVTEQNKVHVTSPFT